MKIAYAALMSVVIMAAPVLADKRLDEAVAKAEDQFQKGRGDEALKTLQKAVSQNPSSPEAYLVLARMQERVASLEEAAASIAKAVDLGGSAGGPVKAEALAAQSAMDLRRGSARDAVAHAQEAVKLQATPATLAALARAQAHAQDATAALQTAERAMQAGAASASAHEARGQALLALERAVEAADAFRKALGTDPKHHEARIGLAAALLAQGKTAEAVAEAKKASEANPKSGEAFAVWGMAILGENPKNWSEAIAQAQQGAFLEPKNPRVQYAVGKIFEHSGNLDQAAGAYRKALQSDPGFVPARAALIYAQVRRGELDAALAEAQKLAAEMPQSGEAQLQVGKILLRKNDFAGALPALERAAALSPGSAEAQALLGTAYQYLRKTSSALEAYKRATELAPQNLDYRATYGLILGLSGQHEAGIAELQKVISTPGYKSAAAYINLGWAYRNMKPPKTEESVAAYKKAMEIEPKNPQAALGLARAYFNANRLDDAIAMYQQAMQLDPKLAGEANIGLAWSYVFKEDYAQARAYADKAQASLRPDDPRLAQIRSNIEQREAGKAAEVGPEPEQPAPIPTPSPPPVPN